MFCVVNLDEIFAYGRNVMKKILLALILTLALFASACDSSTSVPVDPDAPEANITIISGDGLYALSDTVHLSYTLANGQVRWATDRSDLIAVDSNGIVSAKPRTAAIAIQPVIIQAQSNGAETGKITLYVGDYRYDESTKTYHIYSELGLNHWVESENALTVNVTLERDITLTKPEEEYGSNWPRISDYNATFDGQDHTIKGLTLNIMSNHPQFHGFFSTICSDAVIRNLNLTDVHIDSSISQYIGAIAGYSEGGIEDCTVSGSVEGEMYVGGIAGYQNGGRISGCKNYCNVQAIDTAASAGGVAGDAGNCDISNCYNYGTITATGFNVVAAGGIVGQTGFGAIISGCHNSGDISGENFADSDPYTQEEQRLCLGGIVGRLFGSSSSVTNCSIKDGITIDASYYSSWLVFPAAVGHIVGEGTVDSSNTGEAEITKKDLSSSGTSTSP